MAEMWAIMVVIIGSFFGAVGALMFKMSAGKFSLNLSGLLKNKEFFIGAFFYIISVILFTFALRGGELSVLFPVVSTSYIWTALFSMKFLNEKMNKLKWFGIVLIIMGICIISVS